MLAGDGRSRHTCKLTRSQDADAAKHAMPRSSGRYGALAAALIAAAVHAQTPALPAYGITLIPAPSSSTGLTVAAISSADQLTGSIAFSAGQAAHAFVYTSGTVIDLGTLPYPGSADLGSASGMSISNGGQIVGTITDTGTPPMWQFGFTYDPGGALESLNTLTGFPFCTATGVNDSGLIVGSCSNLNEQIATMYVNGTPQQIGPTGAAANAVNDYNQVAASGTPGFIYDNGTITKLPLLSGGSANTQSSATSINNAGQAVGWQLNGTTYQTFFYSYGATSALTGVPGSNVQPRVSINNAGQIVGYTVTSASATAVPFFYAHGLMSNLNALVSTTDPSKRYVTLTQAYGISDTGQIIASGTDSRTPGVTNAYLLTPISPLSPFVDLEASVTTVVEGTAFTLFWTAQSLSGCTASGGSGSDDWLGAMQADGGQQLLKEMKAGSYDFTLNCMTSTGAPQDSTVTVMVTAKPPTPPHSGGGALDARTLLALLLLCGWRVVRGAAGIL
jgi:hypothetical protein